MVNDRQTHFEVAGHQKDNSIYTPIFRTGETKKIVFFVKIIDEFLTQNTS